MQSASSDDGHVFLALTELDGGVQIAHVHAPDVSQVILSIVEARSAARPDNRIALGSADNVPLLLSGFTNVWCWTSHTEGTDQLVLVTVVQRQQSETCLTHVSFAAGSTLVETTKGIGRDAALELANSHLTRQCHVFPKALGSHEPNLTLLWDNQYAIWYYAAIVAGTLISGVVVPSKT